MLAIPARANESFVERAMGLHEGAPAEFEVVDSPGGPVSVIGRFPTSLGMNAWSKPAAASRAVAELVERVWLVSPHLQSRDARPVDDNFDIITFDEYVNGLRVLDRAIVVGFWADGSIQSVNGVVVEGTHPTTTPIPRLTPDDALAIACSNAHQCSNEEYRADATDRWSSAFGGQLEFGWSDHAGGPAWRIHGPYGTQIIDDELATVVSSTTNEEFVTGDCDVRIYDHSHDSLGRATSMNENLSKRVERLTCEATDYFGTCYWQLRREPWGFAHGIARVQDANDGEQEIAQACSSAAIPQFTGTSSDALREQGAFYIANQMRYFTNQNVWSQVPPAQNANIQITVDDDGTCASFNPFMTDIRCNQNDPTAGNCCTTDALAHEYGHYVTWTYGGELSDLCVNNGVQSNSVEETIATDFGFLFYYDDPEVDPTYGALAGFALGNAPSPHTDASSLLPFTMNCSTTLNQRVSGFPFSQALWEVLWNRNCQSNDTCTIDMFFGSTIWPSPTGREQVITNVGSAMGWAMSVLGPDVTYQQVRAQMRSRILAVSNAAAAEQFQRVFSHHGFTCPSCCTGC